MVRGQTVAQAHRQIERLLVVHRLECSFHAYQYTMTDGECLFLSDKLLDEWFVQRVLSEEQRREYAAAIAFFLGINPAPAAVPAPAPALTSQGRQVTGQ